MIQKVEQYIREQSLIMAGDKVIAGVSGGADSTCLLYVLKEIAGHLPMELMAVHINHCLRGDESERDEQFVRKLCKKLDVALICRKVNVRQAAETEKISLEAAGRAERYRIFQEVLEGSGFNKIAIAHNKNDDAETVLFNLFRGSGLRGLSGIPDIRGDVVRPLLTVSRAEIEDFLSGRGISFCMDSTNQSSDFTRNFIRNNIMPEVVEHINPAAIDNIQASAQLLRKADNYFCDKAEAVCKDKSCVREGYVSIPLLLFKDEPPIVQQYMIRWGIQAMRGHMLDISAAHIGQVSELLDKHTGKMCALPGGYRAVRGYNELVFERQPEDTAQSMPGFQVDYQIFDYDKCNKIPRNQYTKWFDCDKIEKTLAFRTRQGGDFIAIKPKGTKSIKSLMIDEKIPRNLRDQIPLLADGQHIIWMVGYHRISEAYKITEETKRVLQVSVLFEDREEEND